MKLMRNRKRQRGVAMVEFSLAGIAAATLLISTVQLGISMWNYHTMAYAVHETNRYIASHGRNCSLGGNSCTITVGDIVTKFKSNAIGLPAGSASLTLTSNSGTVQTCNPISSCANNSTQWPPTAHFDNREDNYTTLTGQYTSNSAIVALWAGTSGTRISSVTLKSQSKLKILF